MSGGNATRYNDEIHHPGEHFPDEYDWLDDRHPEDECDDQEYARQAWEFEDQRYRERMQDLLERHGIQTDRDRADQWCRLFSHSSDLTDHAGRWLTAGFTSIQAIAVAMVTFEEPVDAEKEYAELGYSPEEIAAAKTGELLHPLYRRQSMR
jgi:hypothetical protein